MSQSTGGSTFLENNENRQTSAILDEINSDEVGRLVPLIVYLLVLSMTGILGNGMVCYIYKQRSKSSNTQLFILVLSIIDLFSCAIVVPFEISTVMMQYNFEQPWACRMSRFCNTMPNVSSGFVLVLIAIDRYRKVCKPFEWQISRKTAKCLCVGTNVLGVLFAFPALAIYGKHTFYVTSNNVTASECSTDDSMTDSTLPFINNSFFGFLFLVGTSTLTILYTCIGHTVRRHAQDEKTCWKMSTLKPKGRQNKDSSSEGKLSESEAPLSPAKLKHQDTESDTIFGDNSESSSSDNKPADDTHRKSPEELPEMYDQGNNLGKYCEKYSKNPNGQTPKRIRFQRLISKLSSSSFGTNVSDVSGSGNKRFYIKQARARKMTYLMFLISLAYVLSYLPHVLLMILRAVKTDFVDSMTDTERAAYKFFLRSYVLNAVVNPFIYGACDSKFRTACRRFIKSIFK